MTVRRSTDTNDDAARKREERELMKAEETRDIVIRLDERVKTILDAQERFAADSEKNQNHISEQIGHLATVDDNMKSALAAITATFGETLNTVINKMTETNKTAFDKIDSVYARREHVEMIWKVVMMILTAVAALGFNQAFHIVK